MIIINYSRVPLKRIYITINSRRTFSTQITLHKPQVSSKVIRQQFLDFFIKDNSYNFVRSSPVVPYHDPTVPFVNAGMNQFKGVFLGTQTPKFQKVTNSQKCIRVGGKHNDLDVVGTDGYHHTFFEMLGNWTFGNCSKRNACGLAWKLLTDVYKLDKNVLYVTYFGGDEKLQLVPDLECKEVWRSIGVPDNRILPFGMKDNFWEMGATGPCGPCTEIHFDHGGRTNRSQFVNKGLHELVELWNIVFIEYNRTEDGKIEALPKKHVDTGMGFERLVAAMQGKISNYDTDVFKPIFAAIQKNCTKIPQYKNRFGENDWDRLNTGYRILADHIRMMTISLGDGMIPEQNQKLRKVMRRAFTVSENTFKRNKGFMKELSNYVIECLGPVYPEVENNAKQIHQIIDYEEEVFQNLRTDASKTWSKIAAVHPALQNLDVIETPGLVYAYKDIVNAELKEITPSFGFKLFDTYGLDEDNISKLSKALQLKFDNKAFKSEMANVKMRSRQSGGFQSKQKPKLMDYKELKTNDTFKYDYWKDSDGYVFSNLPVVVRKIIKDGMFVSRIPSDTECTVILDKTNMYTESGGQISDYGTIKFATGEFDVYAVENQDQVVMHTGVFKSPTNLHVNMTGFINVNEDTRMCSMQNHTATHLLNACLKELKGATCQMSSKVTKNYLNLDVGIFSGKLSLNDIKCIENSVNNIIHNGADVKTREIDCQSMLCMDNVTLIPGEIYPESDIRLIEISMGNKVLSREPCCGTHVLNASDIESFTIISSKSLGRSTTSLYAVTGERSELAKRNANELLADIAQLRKDVSINRDEPDVLEMALQSLKQRLVYDADDDSILPYTVRVECNEKLLEIGRQLKESSKSSLKEFIDVEMKSVLASNVLKSNSNKKFLLHYLRTSMMLDSVPLQRATKLCPNWPILVIAYSDSAVKARCCVPTGLVNSKFNAEKWLQVIGDIFQAPIAPPRGQDALLVCNMKSRKVNISEWRNLLRESMLAAELFAKEHL